MPSTWSSRINQRLEVGHIAKAHGLRGELVVTLTSDRQERLTPGTVLHAEVPRLTGGGGVAGDRDLTIESARPHQGRWLVCFAGVDSREAADALRGASLSAEPIEDPDVWFVHDLIGKPVVLVRGGAVGECVAVVDNPAHDLLELDTGALVPLPFVIDVGDAIVIDPPEGLLDLEG